MSNNNNLGGWKLLPTNNAAPGQVLQSGPNGQPQWANVNINSWNVIDGNYVPTVTVKKYAGTVSWANHSLEKIEPKKWAVVNLTFNELVLLQEHGVKYTWCVEKEDDTIYDKVFIVFETDEDEAQAIMLIGTVPYDKE